MQTDKVVTNDINKSDKVYAFLLFLLSPLLSVIVSINKYKASWAKNIIWLYAAFYGFTFVIGNSTSDVNRYKSQFMNMKYYDYSVIEYFQYLLNNERSFDYLQSLIMFIISYFTDDFRVALGGFGLIFGYFYSRNIWNILSYCKGRVSKMVVLFLAVFAIVYTVWDINVLRFTIASHIFFYGTFNYLVNKKKWGVLIAASAMLMHYTLSLAFIVLLIYKLVGNKSRIYFLMFLLSLVASEINLSSIRSSMTFLPKSIQEDSKDYINEDYKEYRQEINEQKNFRGKFYQPALKWSAVILLIYVFFRRKVWLEKHPLWFKFYCFTLLFFTIFNFLSSIPVMNRFVFLAILFALAFLAVYFTYNKTLTDSKVNLLVAPLLLFYFVVKFRIGLEFTGFFTLIGNPILALYNEGDIAFINFLK